LSADGFILVSVEGLISSLPGQVVNTPVMPQPGGVGAAFVNGHRARVDPSSNRIMRVFNWPLA
jgi:hypothetical protein